MSTETLTPPPTALADTPREKLTKKAITADHPTWCPGCAESFRGPRHLPGSARASRAGFRVLAETNFA
ncbi:MAG: hypothetical protein H0V56_09900 [Chthoniobacterales bacterium]|nr:hypothetical protein [Chthoniobacterales bacterium]